ncbi:SDR family NAD(P)-dependent oxidoreductase [Conexibacter sp. CPCC 206217]|uniref:SDR family NAD(P)-dependent oxidoreductase n=1 Tax=Conexibacter sp. CPCC 206217 TaxID=3064574 RepID=UPI00271D65B6|nr:glucose 1-dehydrogenase [Conexibacter sp. CPCC 206217]MDO8211146.1 glucose 1-dehydrogenase [Conexibacter sp. CPCC 206217]
MPGRLDGKVVLVSGAARGMGEADARVCAREGAAVVLGDVLLAEGEAVAASIVADGGRAAFVQLDVSSAEDWKRAVAVAVDEFGGLDGLVNNAGICPTENIEQTTLESWQRVLAVNQTGTFLGMQTALPALRAAGSGSIVNVSSVMSFCGGQGGIAAAYAATKGAIQAMSKGAAMEFGRDAIRVNSIHPGTIDTPMAAAAGGPVDGDARRAFQAMSPLNREGTPEEVAATVLFLLSDESAFITGSEVVVDGGFSTH